MDQRLIDEINRRRAGRCPRHVRRAIREARGGWGLSLPRLAFAVTAMALGVFLVIHLYDGRLTTERDGQELHAAEASPDPRQTAHETYASLALVGQSLIEAGEKGGNILLEKTGSSLRRGLATFQSTFNLQNH